MPRRRDNRTLSETPHYAPVTALMHAAIEGGRDAQARLEYSESIKRNAQRQRLLHGKMRHLSAGQAASQAVSGRNEFLAIARAKSSELGRIIAKAVKETGMTLGELRTKYVKKLLGTKVYDYYYQKYGQRWFSELHPMQRNRIHLHIIQKSGESNQQFNKLMRSIGWLSKIAKPLSFMTALFDIASSNNPAQTAARWGFSFVGAGAGASAAALGVVCGPATIPCAVGFGITGSIAGATLGESLWDRGVFHARNAHADTPRQLEADPTVQQFTTHLSQPPHKHAFVEYYKARHADGTTVDITHQKQVETSEIIMNWVAQLMRPTPSVSDVIAAYTGRANVLKYISTRHRDVLTTDARKTLSLHAALLHK